MHHKKHLLPLLLLLVGIYACKNDDDTGPSINYPEGIIELNGNTSNDCNLPRCSMDRVSRLKAEEVSGIINENFDISTAASFDTHVLFLTCNLDSTYWKPGMHVKFSGDVKDGCGIWEAIHPLEGVFIVHLSQIDSIWVLGRGKNVNSKDVSILEV